ncbi:MAG: hypothetical protein IV107_21240 [Paucibacter sp.]|nr:hypothetical protein [Roseateles sp.]
MERAALLSDGDVIEADTMQTALQVGVSDPIESGMPKAVFSVSRLRQLEDQTLRIALQRHLGSREQLAGELKVSVRTLYRRLARMDAIP